MYGIIRRYESTDKTRTSKVVDKVKDGLVPKLSELPGFNGYFLIEGASGVMSSVSFFDTAAHAEESTQSASNWVRDWEPDKALPIRRRSPWAKSSSMRRASSSRPNTPSSRSSLNGGLAIAGPVGVNRRWALGRNDPRWRAAARA